MRKSINFNSQKGMKVLTSFRIAYTTPSMLRNWSLSYSGKKPIINVLREYIMPVLRPRLKNIYYVVRLCC